MSELTIPIEKILPNPDQPRTIFDQAELEGLAQSIKENGLIQPIVVEQEGIYYILVDGERRLRAHQLAGLTTIPAVVRPTSNHNGADRSTHALIANIQRSAMGFIDEAKAYEKLMAQLGSIDAVASKTGMSTATVSARLSLLDLSDLAQKFYNLKKLPFDLSVISMFKKLKHEDQDRLASASVTRGWRTESILRSGRRMLQTKKTYVPVKRQVKEIEVKGKFDALAMVQKDIPANLKDAARRTCKACAMYGEASLKVCNQCPLPEFLNKVAP